MSEKYKALLMAVLFKIAANTETDSHEKAIAAVLCFAALLWFLIVVIRDK